MGTFAFVTTTNGLTWVVNIDDDNYQDREDLSDPLRVSLPLALPHTPRDFVAQRDALAAACAAPPPDPLVLGPRLASPPDIAASPAQVDPEKLHELPSFLGVSCGAEDAEVVVSELSYNAPAETRERAYPDLAAVANETWFLVWEGGLSLDGPAVAIDGPPVRKGELRVGEGQFTLRDPTSPFCGIGVEPYDIAVLNGCDPARGDSNCGVGELCFVHPDAPATVTNGTCLPRDRVDSLSGECRQFLIGRRQYSVRATAAEVLTLGERTRLLRTSPLEGCESDAQCAVMAEVAESLVSESHPNDFALDPDAPQRSWTCRADPSRAPGPDRCLMSCGGDADCESGYLCSGGLCVAGVVPPEECLGAAQRYQLRVGDAFSLIGERSGFLHSLVRDPESGACVVDPDAHPLEIGRVPLDPPPCDDDGNPYTGPNPCQTAVDQLESFTPFEVVEGVCRARQTELRRRLAPAVRVENPALRFHLVDTATRGDAECRGDKAGEFPLFSPVYAGYQLSLAVVGGFLPFAIPDMSAAFPISIIPGPGPRLWVLDAGDAANGARGRIFAFDPRAAAAGFAVTIIE